MSGPLRLIWHKESNSWTAKCGPFKLGITKLQDKVQAWYYINGFRSFVSKTYKEPKDAMKALEHFMQRTYHGIEHDLGFDLQIIGPDGVKICKCIPKIKA